MNGIRTGLYVLGPTINKFFRFSSHSRREYSLWHFGFYSATCPHTRANGNCPVQCIFEGAVEDRVQHFLSMQVFTSHLRVEEGGLTPVTERHILISDVDTKQEYLLLLLQRQPQHGAVELNGIPMNEGDRLSSGDLRTLAVRLEEWLSSPLAMAELDE